MLMRVVPLPPTQRLRLKVRPRFILLRLVSVLAEPSFAEQSGLNRWDFGVLFRQRASRVGESNFPLKTHTTFLVSYGFCNSNHTGSIRD